MTDYDYEALAAEAEKAHREANERYTLAVQDSQMAAFHELVFTAASCGIATVSLEPSDQGDWMTIAEYLDENGDEPEEDVEEDLADAAMDLPDSISSYWALLPGVTYNDSRRSGDTATIDITVAAPAAAESFQPLRTWPVGEDELRSFSAWQDAVANHDTHLGFREWLTNRPTE